MSAAAARMEHRLRLAPPSFVGASFRSLLVPTAQGLARWGVSRSHARILVQVGCRPPALVLALLAVLPPAAAPWEGA